MHLTEKQYQERKEFLRGASTTMLWKNIDPESVDGTCKLTYEEEKSFIYGFLGVCWKMVRLNLLAMESSSQEALNNSSEI